MLSNIRNAKMEAAARVIAEHVRDIGDVVFTSDLVQKIAKATKLQKGKSLTNRLKYLWKLSDSVLKIVVREILMHGQSRDIVANKIEISTAKTHGISKVTEISNSNVDFQKINVESDGNCLFRAFAIHLFNDESRHLEVRKSIVEYVVQNWDECVDTLIATCIDKSYTYAEEYENCMGKDREFGTDFEIGIFVKLYKIDVALYEEKNGHFSLKYPFTYPEASVGKLNLLFIGSERSGHFMILKAKEESCEERKDRYEQVENEKDSLNVFYINSNINDVTLTSTNKNVALESDEVDVENMPLEMESIYTAESGEAISEENEPAVEFAGHAIGPINDPLIISQTENEVYSAYNLLDDITASPLASEVDLETNEKSREEKASNDFGSFDDMVDGVENNSIEAFCNAQSNSKEAVDECDFSLSACLVNDDTETKDKQQIKAPSNESIDKVGVEKNQSDNVITDADSLKNVKSDKTSESPIVENVSAITPLLSVSTNSHINKENTIAANDCSNDTKINDRSFQVQNTSTGPSLTDPINGDSMNLQSEDEMFFPDNPVDDIPRSPLINETDDETNKRSAEENATNGANGVGRSTIEQFCTSQSNSGKAADDAYAFLDSPETKDKQSSDENGVEKIQSNLDWLEHSDEDEKSHLSKRRIFTRSLQQRHPDGNVGYKMYEESTKESVDAGSDESYSIGSDIGSESSDKENTDTEFKNLCKDVENKKKKTNKKERMNKKKEINKKDKKFPWDIGTMDINSTSFKNEQGVPDREKTREVLSYLLRDACSCTCLLSFYGSVRFNSRSISAYAKCASAEHDQSFKFEIHNLNHVLAKVVIKSDSKIIKTVHERDPENPKYLPIKGTERKEMKEQLDNQSVKSLVKKVVMENSTELLADGHPGSIRRTQVYYKIRSEEKNKNRLQLQSRDLLDIFQMWLDENQLKDPFLRFVGLDLTAQMYAEKDLDILLDHKKAVLQSDQKNVVLHIDATGSIVRKPEGLDCKRILYYCILFRHNIEIIKVAQMITSEHNTASIGNWLNNFRYFATQTRKWPIADIIVTDWAWATIHSIIKQWNDMDIERYLQLTFNVLEKKENVPTNFIYVKLCFGHFTHNITQTIDKLYVARKKDETYPTFKQVLKGCIQLLCVAKNLKSMYELFKHVCVIFLNKSAEIAEDSIRVITGLKNQHGSKLESAARIPEDKEYDEDLDAIFDYNEKGDAIYRNSPYYVEFNKIMTTQQMNASERNDKDYSGKEMNPFYAPEFMEKVITKWMAYAILWSSLDLDIFAPNISRVSNAYVESSNKIMKEIVLKGYTRSSIGNAVRALKTDQESTRALIAIDEKLTGSKKSRNKPLYPTVESERKDASKESKLRNKVENSQAQSEADETSAERNLSQKREMKKSKSRITDISQSKEPLVEDTKEDVASNPLVQETWNKKKQPKRKRTTKINISTLLKVGKQLDAKEKSRKVQKFEKNEEKSIDEVNDLPQDKNENEFDTEKEINKRKRDHSPYLEDSNPCKISKLSSPDEKLYESSHINEFEELDTDKARNVEKSKFSVARFFNGLVKDPHYYMNWKQHEITIARYDVEKYLNRKTIYVTTREFPTLLTADEVNLTIVDAFAAASLNEWMDLTYISTDDSTPIVGKNSDKRVNRNLRISQTTETLRNVIFMPYVYLHHIQLVILNIEKEELTLLNPYEAWEDYDRVLEALKHFINNCCEGSSFNRLKNIKWVKGDIMNNRPYQSPYDTINCGLYVMHYMDCIGKQKQFDMNFNPSEYRKDVAHSLLLKSANMEDQCIYCSSTKLDLMKIKCQICYRQSHEKCTIRSDEENYLKINEEEPYICKLCRKYKEFVESETKT